MILFPKQYFIKKYLLRMQGDLIAAFQYLKKGCKSERDYIYLTGSVVIGYGEMVSD